MYKRADRVKNWNSQNLGLPNQGSGQDKWDNGLVSNPSISTVYFPNSPHHVA